MSISVKETTRTPDYLLAARAAQELSAEERVALAEYMLADIDEIRAAAPESVSQLEELLRQAPEINRLVEESKELRYNWARLRKAQSLLLALDFELPEPVAAAAALVITHMWRSNETYTVAVHQRMTDGDGGVMVPSGTVLVRFGTESQPPLGVKEELLHVGLDASGDVIEVSTGYGWDRAMSFEPGALLHSLREELRLAGIIEDGDRQ